MQPVKNAAERAGVHKKGADVAYGSDSDLRRRDLDVRVAFDSGPWADMPPSPRSAINGHQSCRL
jgi:hypothetical protein